MARTSIPLIALVDSTKVGMAYYNNVQKANITELEASSFQSNVLS